MSKRNPELILMLDEANGYAKVGNFQQAVERYREILSHKGISSVPIKAYQNLSNFLLRTGEVEEAIKFCDLNFNLQNGQGQNNKKINYFCCLLAEVIVQLSVKYGKLDDVLAYLERKVGEAQPNDPWLHYYLGTLSLEKADLSSAVQAYKEVLFIQPDFEQVHLQLAKVFLEKGEFEESFRSYVKALQVNPKITKKMKDFLFTFLQRASSELSAQQMDEKVKVFLSVTNEETFSSLHSRLGEFYAKQGKFLEAISYNKEYCRIKLRRVLPDYLLRCMDKGRLVDPHFLLIGVMKCGTTSLYDYICQHPKVLPASRKELRFLNWAMNEVGKQEMESRGFRLPDLYKELYISQLPPVIESEGFITGEASPGYWKIVDLEKLIHASFPQTKLLVIVRDPVKRAVSQYHMDLRNGKTKQTFQEIIESELQDLYDIKDWNEVIARTKSKNYLGHGLYVYALEKWMRIFSSEKLLVLNSKDLANNSDLVMEQVFQFLSLEKYSDIQYSEKNKGSYSSRVDENLIAKMYNFYRPHNQRLEELLGRKFNWS